MKKSDFEESILMEFANDWGDLYRGEYNEFIEGKTDNANGRTEDKYVTVTISKKNVEEARSYFARAGAELAKLLAAIGSHCEPLSAIERLQILYDVYRGDGNKVLSFDMKDSARKGHSFKDCICPDSIEKHSDYLKLGEKYVRVMYLKDYANYIKDSMVAELMEPFFILSDVL